MALENKLKITESCKLAEAEERISKQKALELFQTGKIDQLEAGKFSSLAKYTNFYLVKYTILQEKSERLTLQKEIFVSPLLYI